MGNKKFIEFYHVLTTAVTMKMWKRLSTMIIILFLFTGCLKQGPEEKLFSLYEHAAVMEKDFAASDQQRVELEQKEEELYKQIIQNGEKSSQNVESIIEEAIESVNKRKSLIEKELQIIKEAHEETAKSKKLTRKIKEQTVKEKAQQIQNLYEERYDTFLNLEKNYQLTIQLEQQLYADLKDQTQDLKALDNKISTLNEQYGKNALFQKTFSNLSSQLNDAKKDFYQVVGISIK